MHHEWQGVFSAAFFAIWGIFVTFAQELTYDKSMKKHLLFVLTLMAVLTGQAQVPQFSNTDFENWIYNNPSIPLTGSNILNNKIALYVTSTGVPLTLTSPEFSCQYGETIDMNVTWITPQWQNQGFQVNWVALTAALLDESGVTVDSVTCVPDPISRTNHLEMSLVVPRSISHARLRFAAWKAIVSNCGMVQKIKATSFNKADVNEDGEVTIADVNAIISVILDMTDNQNFIKNADVNEDGEVTISDVNYVIKVILG